MDDVLPPTTSATQLATYAACARRYEYQYVLNLEPEHRSPALVLGSAIHGAVGFWFEERLAGRAPTRGQAEDVLAAELLAGALGPPVRWKHGSGESLEEDARRLLTVYLDAMGGLPVVEVEREVAVEIVDPVNGVAMPRRLRAYFDLVLDDGRIIELKTAGRAWTAEANVTRSLQLGSYAYAAHRATGIPAVIEAHVLVKLRRQPRLDIHRVARTDHSWWTSAAVALERAIADLHFPPSPGPLCASCEYARACAGRGTSRHPRSLKGPSSAEQEGQQ